VHQLTWYIFFKQRIWPTTYQGICRFSFWFLISTWESLNQWK